LASPFVNVFHGYDIAAVCQLLAQGDEAMWSNDIATREAARDVLEA
jgi:hypothetical protein